MTETIRVEDIPADKRDQITWPKDLSARPTFEGKEILSCTSPFSLDVHELPDPSPEDKAELDKLMQNYTEKNNYVFNS